MFILYTKNLCEHYVLIYSKLIHMANSIYNEHVFSLLDSIVKYVHKMKTKKNGLNQYFYIVKILRKPINSKKNSMKSVKTKCILGNVETFINGFSVLNPQILKNSTDVLLLLETDQKKFLMHPNMFIIKVSLFWC